MTLSSLVLQTTLLTNSLSSFRRTQCAGASSRYGGGVAGRLAGCLRFFLHNISECIDYTTVSYTACCAAFKVISNITPNFTTNCNVCDATLRMDDMVSEKSQSSETSRTTVYPKVSHSSLSTVEKQSSDASRFETTMGSRCKDLFPTEKSVDATLLKPHLLGVSRQTHCSIPSNDYLYWSILV